MRLINTDSLELHDFLDDGEAPQYAILSHTWEKEEVTFQDMKDRHSRPEVQSMIGYSKIQQCCRQAKKDGYAWTWVDTCCIDKSSSAELSEAINSMYRWYQKASMCYAFLSDFTRLFRDHKLRGVEYSRWFTRGWKLQELIAPQSVVFYNSNWQELGTKHDLCAIIEAKTGIPKRFLLGEKNIASASIAMRMSWAAERQTSRVEDRAYSLLGLFDINIPLIYGEGAKAFRRLQEEIIRTEPYEHTIYAWGRFTTWQDGLLPNEVAGEEELGVDTKSLPLRANIEWSKELANQPLLGLLARSPADFADSANFVPAPEARDYITTSTIFTPPVFLHGGVRLRPRLLNIGSNQMVHHLRCPPIVQLRAASYVALLVQDSSRRGPHDVIIPMVMWNKFNWGRKFDCLVRKGITQTVKEELDLFIAPEHHRDGQLDLIPGDIVFRWGCWGLRGPMVDKHPRFETDKTMWEQLDGEQAIIHRDREKSFNRHEAGRIASWAFKMVDSHKSWSIVVHRLPYNGRLFTGALAFSIVRTQTEGKQKAERMDGHIWYPPLVLRSSSFQDLADMATCRHVVKRRTDIWRPEAAELPAGIVLCVETVRDGRRGGFFEVIDFRFPDSEGDSHLKIPRAD